MRGTVTAFGADGWGEIQAETGSTHPFHCTAIADGSRSIEPGTSVEFRVVPGRRGKWEATEVTR